MAMERYRLLVQSIFSEIGEKKAGVINNIKKRMRSDESHASNSDRENRRRDYNASTDSGASTDVLKNSKRGLGAIDISSQFVDSNELAGFTEAEKQLIANQSRESASLFEENSEASLSELQMSAQDEVSLSKSSSNSSAADLGAPTKPRFFNRVKTGMY